MYKMTQHVMHTINLIDKFLLNFKLYYYYSISITWYFSLSIYRLMILFWAKLETTNVVPTMNIER
jgi:hypothetical protein